jgi:uncharacterized zinc-type alcohol dehydrogenase-like protein
MPIATRAFAAFDAKKPLAPFSFERRDAGPRDVVIDIAFCGVCHSDIHQARNEWSGSKYPMVPGHEIVGRVSAVGAAVKRFSVGEQVGVGCMVDSCRDCGACKGGLEQYCDSTAWTYNGALRDGTATQGGYSSCIVVDENFVLRLGSVEKLDAVAPLLCAGITLYSPLRHWKVERGMKVAIVGLGGLGHMGVKLAAAMGAEVTVVSSSPSKRADATRLGAADFLTVDQLPKSRFDLIVNTVSAKHALRPLVESLRLDGTLVLVGVPEHAPELEAMPLIHRRRQIAGSLIGGIAETQEMLDFCAMHKLTADIETLPLAEVNTAYERMLKSDVRYRFVLAI